MVEQVEVTMKEPKHAAAVGGALDAFIQAAIKDHQTGGGGVSADLQAAAAAFVPVIGDFASVPAEVAGDGLGVAEALGNAVIDAVRKSKGLV